MASVLTPPRLEGPAGGGIVPPESGGGERPGRGRAASHYKTGMWLGLAAMVMVFAAFTSAMVVRRGAAGDWRWFALPPVLWLNTVVLVASSLTIHRARRDAARWLNITAVLGLVFLAGQYVAWRQLYAAGVYLASNPSNSFFYLLTGAHGLHLAGGVLALFYVVLRAWQSAAWVNKQAAIEALSLYWHFMDGLWIYLFLLVLVGR